MIYVEMNLVSAVSSERDRDLCTIEIINDDTGTPTRGNYTVKLYARNNGRVIRTAHIRDYPRQAQPAWRLLSRAMKALEEK